MPGCEWRGSGALQESSDLFDIALPTLTETLRPLRGENQDRSWLIEAGCRRCCPQQAWISRPSSSTGKRTTSRIGGGFSSSGGLRPSAVRMRFTEISSLTYATTFSLPPHWRQTSGSAWYTLLMSLAQLGGQRRLVVGSAGRPDAPVSRREAPTLPCQEAVEECPVLTRVRDVIGRLASQWD